MVKSLSYRIILGLVFVVPTICLSSQEDSWYAMGSFKSSQVRNDTHTLDIFYQKKDGNPSAVLKLDGAQQWQVEIPNFDKLVVDQIQENLRYAKNPECVYLALVHGEQEHNLRVKSVKCFYGPEEYHNLPKRELSTNGDIMKIRDCDDAGVQEVLLYQPENIKKIVDALNQSKGCIINLRQTSSPAQQVKVIDYTSTSWFWWNGWQPGFSNFYGWPGMPHYDIEKETEYNFVDINVEEDQKHEAIYTKNQRISRWIKFLSLVSSCGVLYYLLQDKIDVQLISVLHSFKKQ